MPTGACPAPRPSNFILLPALVAVTFLPFSTAWAKTPPSPSGSPTRTETPEQRAELFIQLLKRRARQILEARRVPPPPLVRASVGLSEGYESNVNLDGQRQGDWFTQESFTLSLRPRITPWLQGEFTYDLFNSHYQELTDSNFWSNNLDSTLQIQPHSRVRLEVGHEYGIANFPFDSDSSFFDHRFKAHLLLAHTAWLVHKAGWMFQQRDYDTRKATDGDGLARGGVNRQDHRHTGSYEVRLSFAKTFLRIAGEYYRNLSNELFEDFYDWDNLRVKGVISRVLTPKTTGVFVASFDRRNYESRSVPAIDVAERDNLYTVAASVIHQITRRLEVIGSITYRYQDSNDPVLDFTDLTYRVGLSISF